MAFLEGKSLTLGLVFINNIRMRRKCKSRMCVSEQQQQILFTQKLFEKPLLPVNS